MKLQHYLHYVMLAYVGDSDTFHRTYYWKILYPKKKEIVPSCCMLYS